jgi:DNA-directed RNA polymerase subunit M/transcription elongation factor TFIIS
MKSFCPSCGSLIQYAGPKPKFCSSCGNSLSSFSKASESPKVVEENQNSDEEEVQSIPDMEGLAFEVERFERKETVGGIMEAYKDIKPPENTQENKAPAPPKISKEQFLENWKKEAGSIRPK